MSDKNKTKLLSSGNPQIPKGKGDAPLQAYIAAMPGWKSNVGRQVNDIVERVLPDVRKAVKWNTPLYGKEDGHFMSMYCYSKYVQLAFMQGAKLDPEPPIASKTQKTRYLNIHEQDELDADQLISWVQQAIKLPGEEF